MDAGGRREMYNLLGLIPPPLPERSKPKKVPKLVIDKKGKTDQARYSGLKMGQVLNDDEMARALEEAQKKEKAGKRLRPKLEEEDYVQPFAGRFRLPVVCFSPVPTGICRSPYCLAF